MKLCFLTVALVSTRDLYRGGSARDFSMNVGDDGASKALNSESRLVQDYAFSFSLDESGALVGPSGGLAVFEYRI